MPVEILMVNAAAKAALLIGAALLGVTFATRASAALRHAILLAAIVAALLLPPLAALLPTFSPVPMADRAASTDPELGRWRDNAISLLLVLPDAGSDPPVRASLRAAVEQRRVAILGIWFAGSAIVLRRIVADLVAARRVCRRATPRGRLGPDVPLLESTEITAAVTVGLFRPVVMIPAASSVNGDAFRSVMAHELAHVERRDCFTQLVIRIACALYWFDPLVWCAARRIALERERACDDRVLAAGADPIAYSQLLIDVAQRHARPRAGLQAVPSMARPAHLERRVAGILDAAATRGGLSRRRRFVLLMVAGVIAVPLASFGLHDRPPLAAASDPFFDPRCEIVDGAPTVDRAPAIVDATTVDGMLIRTLRQEAAREARSPSDLVPDRARWALSRVHEGRILEPMIAALGDPDWRIRAYAAWTLACSADARGVEPLIPLLDDPVWRLRAMAAVALRRIGDVRAAAAMVEALNDPAWQVRVEAVAYLGELGQARFSDRIAPLRNDPHIAVRLAADEALNAIP